MKSRVKDMTGKKIGRLKVVKLSDERTSDGSAKWECICDCGEKTTVSGRSLRTVTKSCGCLQKERQTELAMERNKKYIGKKFARLTVIDTLPIVKRGRSYLKCKCECGKVIKCRIDGLKNGHTKSCGCYNMDNLKSQKGKLSPSYNYDISDEERIKNRTFYREHLKNWRTEVFQRDGYKCRLCNQKGYLHAHHLDGYHWCKEKRFDVDNGITLCKDCHYKFHRTYGNRNNTSKQFQKYAEFILNGVI